VILGVVGHAAEKFTPVSEALAKDAIRKVVKETRATRLSSGHSPMGGVDIWSEEIAAEMGLEMSIHAPTVNRWDGPGGFKDRNLAIAKESDITLVVVVQDFPPNFKGKRFPDCYHCKDRNPPHIKSGGCWTAWRCKKRIWRIIDRHI
jgi:hypothetical protein